MTEYRVWKYDRIKTADGSMIVCGVYPTQKTCILDQQRSGMNAPYIIRKTKEANILRAKNTKEVIVDISPDHDVIFVWYGDSPIFELRMDRKIKYKIRRRNK